MACLIAAAVHDFEHLGFSNDFLVKSCDKRAMMYNGSEETVENRQSSKGSPQSNEDEQTNDNGKTFKRSGRARQRAAKWWAAVRRETPSPDTVSPCCVTSQRD